MPRRPSQVMDIDVETVEPKEIDYEIEQDVVLEQQELEDFEGTDINESEFTERL